MSDSELSDGMEELKELIAEYESKEKQETQLTKPNVNNNETANSGERMYRNKQPKKIPMTNKLRGEVPMDKIIFGDKAGYIEKLKKALDDSEEENEVEAVDDSDDVSCAVALEEGAHKRKAKKRKPVWKDADDDVIQVGQVKRETRFTGPLDHLRKDKSYKEYLTSRFTRIMAQPKWASLDRKSKVDGDSDDEKLLRTVGFLAKPSEGVLSPNNISIKRLKDLNRATYSEGSISSVQFHPSSTAALVAGHKGIATIYSIDGQHNEKLHSILFRDFPIRCAKITPCGTKAIFGSIKRHFFSYDLLAAQEMRHQLPREITTLQHFQLSPCGRYMAAAGRFGMLHLFDAASQELLHTFKQENNVAGLRFTADSRRLITCSESCDINIYSLRQQCLEHMFIDEGCIKGSVIDLSPSQRLLATGSKEGVVNVYDFEKVQLSRAPLPEKRFLNLTTAISDVKFNHSSEVLAMCSHEVHSGVKLALLPNGTVFPNFPIRDTDLGKIRTLEFSPGSGYLAFGNRVKEVSLYRLKHFKNY